MNKHECVFERVRGTVLKYVSTLVQLSESMFFLCLFEYVSQLYLHAFVLPRDPSTSFSMHSPLKSFDAVT